MHFPSDDELMAGPNAFEGVDIDSFDFPEEDGDEASEAAGARDAEYEGSDFGDSDLDEADEEIAQDVADSVDSLRQLRAETNAAADIIIPEFPEDFRAGFISIVGRPNVGKSTFINKLIKKNVANTANKPGVTKKQQWLKLNKDIELLDTPGILMPKFDNQEIGKKLSLIGSIKDDITPLDDVSLYLIELLKYNYIENLNNLYKINVTSDDKNVTIMEKVAEKRFKKIGGDYDYDSTIKLLIQDFRTQKFGLITLDNYSDLLKKEEQDEN